MTSEIGRIIKCFKNQKPSYHALQDDAYSHISLIQSDEPENSHAHENPSNTAVSNLKLDETLIVSQLKNDAIIDSPSNDLSNQQREDISSHINLNSSLNVIAPIENIKPLPPSTPGGLLSIFSFKLHKSSTRHLDRSGSLCESSEKSADPACNPTRYTKFPLKGNTISPTSESSETSKKLEGNLSENCPSSSKRGSDDQSSGSSSLTPQSDSVKSNVCQLTPPETRVNGNPSRSPTKSRKTGSFSPSSFLTSAISSFGKKSGSKGNSSKSKSRLKVKSKSDNNLHKVDLSSVNGTLANIASLHSSGSGSQVCRLADSPALANGDAGCELRLNSVQIGDHATIHLPWRGVQQTQNNLSSVSSTNRVHKNTHCNNFDSSSVRYVECGFRWSKDDSHPKWIHKIENQHTFSQLLKQRSKSLEKDFNYRVNSACSSKSSAFSFSQGSSDVTRSSSRSSSGDRFSDSGRFSVVHHSSGNFGLHNPHRSLTPEEQEILLRNISWNSSDTPPPRPEKPLKFRSAQRQVNSPAADHTSLRKSSNSRAVSRSVTNSICNSSSGSCDSISSRAPSPPPRPPSSLNSESRLITSSSSQKPRNGSNWGAAAVVKSESDNSLSLGKRSNGRQDALSTKSLASKVRKDIVMPGNAESRHFGTITTSSSNQVRISGSAEEKKMSSSQSEECDSFCHKPSQGWLHSDQLLSREGVTYTVRYIGCLDVNTSMKSLDFDTRSLIAKECINQVCEAAGLKSVDRKRKIDRSITRMLGAEPRVNHSGSDVRLTVTSTCLKLTSLESGKTIESHEMPNISFASGGDPTMLDFIAYVAKDPAKGRACYILECGSGLAQDVIITIGQAFELRFKEYIQKIPPAHRLPVKDDPEYYNDLPGKLPPEGDKASKVEISSKLIQAKGAQKSKDIPSLTLPLSPDCSTPNLIDFEAPTPPAFGPSNQEKQLESLLLGPDSPTFSAGPSSSVDSVGTGLGLPNSPSQPNTSKQKDPFEMQPFAGDATKSVVDQKKQLQSQLWFHGCISRSEAEALVQNDGDFLVRESQTTPGQYVLTGQQNGAPKHLLLVDPEGIIRTKDQTFSSVVHLIRHHNDNDLPIISAESIVLLSHPVPYTETVAP